MVVTHSGNEEQEIRLLTAGLCQRAQSIRSPDYRYDLQEAAELAEYDADLDLLRILSSLTYDDDHTFDPWGLRRMVHSLRKHMGLASVAHLINDDSWRIESLIVNAILDSGGSYPTILAADRREAVCALALSRPDQVPLIVGMIDAGITDAGRIAAALDSSKGSAALLTGIL